jgi:hypothetical protein
MGGGVMQLIAIGAQDVFLSGSPEMSFFKLVYKRHTNFSMESVRQTFATKPTLDTKTNTFTCRITRIADLLQDVFISVELPNIYSNENLRFKWVENIANYMIYSYTLKLDTQTIDIVWGEWMDIWNELSLSADKKEGYNRMTGNVEEFMKPKSTEPSVRYNNNRITYFSYPTGGTTTNNPSIASRRLYIPIPFWFSKNPGLALPLIALQYQNIDVVVEVKNIEELYQVYDVQTAIYYSPMGYRELIKERNSLSSIPTATLNGDSINSNIVFDRDLNIQLFNADVSIQRFLVPINQSYANVSSSVDIDAYLECNYVFLDEAERKSIASQSHDFLVERVYRIDKEGIKTQGMIDLVIQNPIKEIIWVARRSDTQKYNTWNFYMNKTNSPILNTAKLLWNGMERFEEKPEVFFNMIQPYKHHTRCPREGIYVYSFALYPEQIQPSGSFNASIINKIQMYVTTNPPLNSIYDYEFIFYAPYYNVFRVMSGSGGMVFAN